MSGSQVVLSKAVPCEASLRNQSAEVIMIFFLLRGRPWETVPGVPRWAVRGIVVASVLAPFVAMHLVTSSFLLLVAMPGATSSVLAPSSVEHPFHP